MNGDSSTRPRVVIVGAGFGGLEAAKSLARAPVDIVLVDSKNHHCFQPLLYQVATAELSPADIAWPIRAVLRKQKNVRVMLGEVRGVDRGERLVHADSFSIPYDFLILATGATHFYFGRDDWEAFAPGLKHIGDATRIRSRILMAFERAEIEKDPAARQRLTTFVVIGAGPTGVEMAGAIAEIAKHTLRADFRNIDPQMARIVLLEAGPRVLPAFPEKLARYAERALGKLGVEVRTDARVTDCNADGVALGEEKMDAATIIWAAGVKASPAAQWLSAPHDRSGRILVNPDLSVADQPNIFAIGDLAAVKDKDGQPVPGVAPAAKQMGKYVGKLIAARIANRKMTPAWFDYWHAGDLATIGRKSAIVKLGWLQLTGFIGWVFWSVAHIYYLIGARNRFSVALNWAWNYVTFQRGARLISP